MRLFVKQKRMREAEEEGDTLSSVKPGETEADSAKDEEKKN